jgi:hypothetical protein
MQFNVNVNGPQGDLWPDYTDPHGAGGENVIARAQAYVRGDVAMRAIDGTHTATGLDFTKDYDDLSVSPATYDWRRNVFVPVTTAEASNYADVYCFTGPVGQNFEGRAVRVGRVKVKCNLASATVTAGAAFKVTNGQTYLTPATAASSGAARIVARATKRQTAPGTGVQLVECYFCGIGAGAGVRFT